MDMDINQNFTSNFVWNKNPEATGRNILDHQDEWDQIDENGDTPLIITCSGNNKILSLKILEYPEKCNLGCANNKKSTALIWACIRCLEEVALKILEYPGKCNLGCADNNNCTALIWACYNKLDEIALKILEYPKECNLGQVEDNNRNTPLTWACDRGLEEVALKLLEYPKECGIGHVTNLRNTPLIIACRKGLEKVAMKLLDYPTECNLDQVNSDGDTAIIWACKFNLKNVVLKMLDYHEHFDFNKLKNNIVLNVRTSDWDNIIAKLESIEKKNITSAFPIYTNNQCLICLDNTNKYYCIPECKHCISICEKCDIYKIMNCSLCTKKINHKTIFSLLVN